MKKLPVYFIYVLALLTVSSVTFAQNGSTPFAGSTHKYTIEPEKSTNTLQWSVLEPTGYIINSQNVVGGNSVANITWIAEGTYKLRFSETDEITGCVTLRELNVVVSNNTFNVFTSNPLATCNAANGIVNFSGSEVTTSISFEVSMETGNEAYNPGWEFTFTLSSGTGAAIGNVKAGATAITPNGETYTFTGLTSTSGTGMITISMEVTGEVYSEETITLEITSAQELQYNTPASGEGINTAIQTINAVPQTSNIITD